MMVHITTTAPPPTTFNLFNFVVVTWQPTILEMTNYKKIVILKPNKYGICHYENLVCELCYSQKFVECTHKKYSSILYL